MNYPYDITYLSPTKMTCTFDLWTSSEMEGIWDVVVENWDGQTGEKVGGFEIKPVPAPKISLTPLTIAFSMPTSAKTTKTITINNSGTANLEVYSIASPWWSETNVDALLPRTLAPGVSKPVSVTFYGYDYIPPSGSTHGNEERIVLWEMGICRRRHDRNNT